MCKVYNTIGSLTHIKNHLRQHNVDGFNSINELLSFQKSYAVEREQLVANQRTLLTAERNNLAASIATLEQEIANDMESLREKYQQEIEKLRQEYDALSEAEKTFVQEFTYSFKALFKLLRITYINTFYPLRISKVVKPKEMVLADKRQQYQYLITYFESNVAAAEGAVVAALDHKKRVIDEITSYIYGARGEQKVVDELKPLSDDYIVINDFTYKFWKPLFHKQQRTYIKTIQIDHLLVSPAGIFLIETKNWSKESVQNLNLRSPIAQIYRTNFALFTIVNRIADFKLIPHHWGERKIPIRNLIVLINHKPAEEFQYVKVLTLRELVNYITYFPPTMSTQETQEIADYLIGLST